MGLQLWTRLVIAISSSKGAGDGFVSGAIDRYHVALHFRPRLTVPMLRLLSSKSRRCKNYWKTSKLCHVGIHWKALAEFSLMSTHLPGFQSFFRIFASFCIGQSSHQQHKG